MFNGSVVQVFSFISVLFKSKRARPRKKQRQERQGNKQQATKGEAKEIKLPCLGKQTTGRKEKQQR